MTYEEIYNNGVTYLNATWNVGLLFLETSDCMYVPHYLFFYNLFTIVINNNEFSLNINPDLIRRYYNALMKIQIIAVSEDEVKQIKDIKQKLYDVFEKFQSYNGIGRQ